ncbi:MAG: hypothetical protein JW704_08060, partial [Anaerolineaceae bacterium]|nr:hypothetical protein [Anaerolineaceae bacterium]
TEATTARDLTYEDHPGHSNYRSMGGSSVTWNSEGYAIVTWQDADWQEQLYYALISLDGSLVTPPMLYKTVGSTYPESQFSTNGSSNAPYLDLTQFFLPCIKR